MVWPAASPDLNPIENYWLIIKRDVYANGRQFTSNEALWEAISDAARAVPPKTIKKLTDSMSSQQFEVFRTSYQKILNLLFIYFSCSKNVFIVV